MSLLSEKAAKNLESLISERFGEPITKSSLNKSESEICEDNIEESTQLGMKAVKNKKSNPWAIAWSKSHHKK